MSGENQANISSRVATIAHGDVLHAAAHLAANRAASRLGVHSRYVADHDVLGGAVVLVAEAVPAALDATPATVR